MRLHFVGVEDLREFFNFNQLVNRHPVPLDVVCELSLQLLTPSP